MTHFVVVDANALVSFFVERNEKQRVAGKALLLSAENGDLTAVVPQFVLFEIAYVLASFYEVPAPRIREAIRATKEFPGVIVTGDCSWNHILEYWPDPFSSITDAAIVGVALSRNYQAIATFDKKLVRRMKGLGVESYY
ncbi:MAG: PIN domain-containing protein [Acidobacteriota bacterium]